MFNPSGKDESGVYIVYKILQYFRFVLKIVTKVMLPISSIHFGKIGGVPGKFERNVRKHPDKKMIIFVTGPKPEDVQTQTFKEVKKNNIRRISGRDIRVHHQFEIVIQRVQKTHVLKRKRES